jgi:hypothetical protein
MERSIQLNLSWQALPYGSQPKVTGKGKSRDMATIRFMDVFGKSSQPDGMQKVCQLDHK